MIIVDSELVDWIGRTLELLARNIEAGYNRVFGIEFFAGFTCVSCVTEVVIGLDITLRLHLGLVKHNLVGLSHKKSN